MQRSLTATLVFLAAGAFALDASGAENICAMPSPGARVATLDWLAGNWIQTSNGQTARERWSGPYGAALLGVGVTTKGETLASHEFFRIAKTPDGVSYFASPDAGPTTEFKAIELCATRVVFENKSHDFPQRVIYAKGAAGTLDARIEGTIAGKLQGQDWHYRREK